MLFATPLVNSRVVSRELAIAVSDLVWRMSAKERCPRTVRISCDTKSGKAAPFSREVLIGKI
jgi:hypothetical protein